ncbi:hypothetical protein BUALT_Bualt07G0044200 [Buddleja alternifolia]|uniref:Calmodulin-binding protein 60 A-like n=1 Tax=Buddleja alternifolia TaxID=168488 RepID=A0AAV6X9G3_9LAMI|nr:hypothetical protein BUALT_Bualt07G0044200 [Buddleja alternifolia]
MKLELRNGISRTIYTGEEIKGDENASIEVALIDDLTGNVVNVEPESSMNTEIIFLKGEFDVSECGDWTVDEFERNIVLEKEGKRPLLAGNVRIKLQRGVGILDNIKLRHPTSKLRPSKFRLGARVVDTFDRTRVKEAITQVFTVKDFRDKYKQKHKTPSLSDKVWRLKYIRKGGPIHKRVESNKISTVEDFLIQLLIDHEGLKRADARELLASAYKHWENTVYVDDDEDSLQQLFTGLNTFVGSQEIFGPDYLLVGRNGESSNGHSNSSFQSVKSALNSGREEDFGSFSTDGRDVIYDDAPMQLSPPPPFDKETLYSDLADFFSHENDIFDMSKADEQMTASHVAVVESRSDHNIKKGLKMWRIFYNVSRWHFSIKKLVSVRGNHKPKKHKVC